MTVPERLDEAVAGLIADGVRRVHVLAWRDLDDADAGGSEVHADHLMQRWAARGLDVVHRTSAAPELPATATRNGYRVVRRGSRMSVFPRTIASELTRRMGRYDAVVEIWNGVPWLTPVWCWAPRLLLLHHVHGPMWDQWFSPPVARFGQLLETRLAPPLYRRGLTVALSNNTADELVKLGFRPDRMRVVPPGVDESFRPGPGRSATPSIVAVGRLAPVKRFELVIAAALEARAVVPDLRLTIVGDGPLRAELAERVAAAGAGEWITFAGLVTADELIAHYRAAWLVVGGSLAEGWGMTMTEGAACATPAVATDIDGHRDSVIDGVTGVLVEPDQLGRAITDLLTDHDRRERLGQAAVQRAETLTWDAAALGITEMLTRAVHERRRSGHAPVATDNI